MKKCFITEWVIATAVLAALIPVLMFISVPDGETLLRRLHITIRYVIPATILILIVSQLWCSKSASR
ncbi:MAG TPA: hypothetical protein ENF21_06950 [Bacteroidetes bacterium]|nr:hypothetical protein [Bacteroidota bacterium]